MKIISFDENIDIEYILKRDILIPCFMYSFSIETKKEGKNILEETIFKLKELDDKLEAKEIATLLGFEDKIDLIKTILEKSFENEENKSKTEFIHFFKEAYTNRFLPFIAKKIDKFYYFIEPNKTFEKNNKKIDVITLPSNFKHQNPLENDFHRVIIKNFQNRNKSEYIKKIPPSKIEKINFEFTPEKVYLHTRFFIPKNNPSTFLITTGFNNGVSLELKELLNNNFKNLVVSLKEKVKTEIEENPEDIKLPFEGIDKYPNIKRLVINIEKNYQNYQNDDLSQNKQKEKEKILKNLFEMIERSFEIITKTDIDIEQSDLLYLLANKFNFKYEKNFKLFAPRKNSIQHYLRQAIALNLDELKELPKNTLIFINKLLSTRDDLMHSNKIDLDSINISKYIKNSYKIISILLHLRQINVENNIENQIEESYFNSKNEIEKEFIDVIDYLDDYILDKLQDIDFYLNEIKYEKDSINVSKNIILSLYSIFEYIFKSKIKNLNITKKDILKKFPTLPKELKGVNEKYILNAQRSKNSTLGGVYLVYVYENNDEKLTNLIAEIIKYRGHGNLVKPLPKEKLLDIKNRSFEYFKKI